MKRVVLVVTVLTLVIVPLGLARPPAAAAADTITILTKERGSEGPALYACYSVEDLTDAGTGNGGVGAACDGDDGTVDGTTRVPVAPCDPCRVSQGLPDRPNDQPTDYLLERPQVGGAGQTFTFRNFLKPYVVVSAVDARTGNRVLGACIVVADVDRGSGVGGCDGASSDRDGRRNGKIQTPRLNNANYLDGTGNHRVDQTSPAPAGYVLGASVEFVADPARTGEFEAVTVKLPPAPRIVITTVDARSGDRLKGACYAIGDKSHGGGLGTFCDGQQSGTFGDQDGRANGVIVTKTLPVGHTYLIDQRTAPGGYRLATRDKSVTTVAGKDASVTVENRRAG